MSTIQSCKLVSELPLTLIANEFNSLTLIKNGPVSNRSPVSLRMLLTNLLCLNSP
jgi:hypothetical protein